METPFSPAQIWRTDCTVCEWTNEFTVSPNALRAEVLKAVKWTTDANGKALPSPQETLYTAYYMNYRGYGRNNILTRFQDNDLLQWKEEVYWFGKWKKNHYSCRALELYQDSVTKIDMMFMNTGMDGIVSGKFDQTKQTNVKFDRQTETGKVMTRPLAIVVMGGRIYYSAADKIWRRKDGHKPSWTILLDMKANVDEAVGGIRGLSAIGNSLMFAWCPNGRSQSCIMRVDVKGGKSKIAKEACVASKLKQYLQHLQKKRGKKHRAIVPFSIAAYNNILEVPTKDGSKVALIGFEACLYWHTFYQNPVDPDQTKRNQKKKPYSYYSGAGYLIRRGPSKYEVRTPYGPRYSHSKHEPDLVATRCYANSPFNDGTVFMGGYDCNFFRARDTAWIVQGMPEAVYAKRVPCFRKDGCKYKKNDRPLRLKYPTPGSQEPPSDPNYSAGAFTCKGHQRRLKKGTHDGETFRCRGGKCISTKGLCNKHKNCRDGSDEEGCP